MRITHGLSLAALVLAGCAAPLRSILPESRVFDAPPLDQITEKELGETLLDKGIIRSYPAIIVTERIDASARLATMNAEPGTFIGTAQIPYGILYRAQRPLTYKAFGSPTMVEGGIMIPQNPTNSPRLYVALSTMIYSDPLKDLKFDRTTASENLPGSFRQELIYNGRSGSTIRFLYREIKDSYLRAPFTQEATYDLTNSDVIGFKGARLKVVEATNSKIRYSVLKTFD